jgi:hypothetical protein
VVGSWTCVPMMKRVAEASRMVWSSRMVVSTDGEGGSVMSAVTAIVDVS